MFFQLYKLSDKREGGALRRGPAPLSAGLQKIKQHHRKRTINVEYKYSHLFDQSCINYSHLQTARVGGRCLSAGLLGSGSSTQLVSSGRFR